MQKWYDSECETSFLGNVKNGLGETMSVGEKEIENRTPTERKGMHSVWQRIKW